jgi:hypothetical protein
MTWCGLSCRANCLAAVVSSPPFPTVTPFIAGSLDRKVVIDLSAFARGDYSEVAAVPKRQRLRRLHRSLASAARFVRDLSLGLFQPGSAGLKTKWDSHRSVLSTLVSR